MLPKSPVPILFLIDRISYGGTEKQLLELVRNLDRSKFEPHICTLKKSDEFLSDLDIQKFILDFTSFTRISVILNVYRLSSYIRCNKIQIIQSFFQDSFVLAALSRPFHSARLIGSFRDLGFWRTPLESLKMRLCLPFYRGFIANSQAVKSYILETDHVHHDKIQVIYNGISACEVHTISRFDKKNKSSVVGIVANLNRPVKKIDDFISAAALVHRSCPEVRFLVVGGGQLQRHFEQLTRTLEIDHIMTFTGRVSNPLDYVRSFNVGVITSESEGFCNAILEYMACGIPVVVTNTGGNPEVVKDGVNGFLVPVGDVDLIAEKIRELLEDNINIKIGEVNRAKITQEFSLESMIMHHQYYYGSVLRK